VLKILAVDIPQLQIFALSGKKFAQNLTVADNMNKLW